MMPVGTPVAACSARRAASASSVGVRPNPNRATPPPPPVLGRLLTRTSAAWLADLRNGQVPCGPINDLAQVFAEPQVRHRQLRLDLPHPLSGSVPGVRSPVLFSRTSLQYDRPPPPLGADTDEVLRQRLGLDSTALAALRSRGVVA